MSEHFDRTPTPRQAVRFGVHARGIARAVMGRGGVASGVLVMGVLGIYMLGLGILGLRMPGLGKLGVGTLGPEVCDPSEAPNELAAWSGDDPAVAGGRMASGAPSPLAPPTYAGGAGRDTRDAESSVTGGESAAQRSEFDTWDPTRAARGEVTGFLGVSFNGWSPPDPHLAVGPDHVLLSTNGSLVVRDKSGDLLFETHLEGTSGFWGELGAGSYVFDPEVAYDPAEDRYFVVAAERVSVIAGYLLLGVSASGDPTGAWHKHRIDVTPLAGSWDVDSPNLAFSESAVFLTADFFQPTPAHLLVTMDKASLLSGEAPGLHSYLHTGSQSFGLAGSPRADQLPYLIEHLDADQATQVRLWTILDPLGNPSLTSIAVDVPSYAEPGVLRSLGTTMEIPLFDARFWSATRVGSSVWACHHVADAVGGDAKTRWYEFEMNGWPDSGLVPYLRQSGTIDPGDGVFTAFPSIAADELGNAYVAFTRSSANEYLSIARCYRTAADPLGVMSTPSPLWEGTGPYHGDRWGDYSATVPDPFTPGAFWTHQQSASNSSQWATWVFAEAISTPSSLPGPNPMGLPTNAGIGTLAASPNPAAGAIRLSLELRHSAHPTGSGASETASGTVPVTGQDAIRLFVHDVRGRAVRHWFAKRSNSKRFETEWDGMDQRGQPVANGVYLVSAVPAGRLGAWTRSTQVVVSR